MIELTPEDLDYIRARGNNAKDVLQQFAHYEKGFDFSNLQAAATVENGIVRLTDDEKSALIDDYDRLINGKRLYKFVPASGAASRMFKDLMNYWTTDDEPTIQKALHFIHSLSDYPFYADLEKALLKDNYHLSEEIKRDNYKLILQYLLFDKGLNYTFLPKALLKFHRYSDGVRTSFEEHLVEAAQYAKNSDGKCYLHFTISPQHEPFFKSLCNEVTSYYEKRFGVKYEITFSTQLPQTDTLAATVDNQPFRDNNGQLLFRPGGHGALLYNLDALKTDLVFIKNIDNVFFENELHDTVEYKKLLAAYLITLQNQLFRYLKWLKEETVSYAQIAEIKRFAIDKLNIRFVKEDVTQVDLLTKLLRPIRVCGMVKNEGEPGGGPFLVKDSEGELSWQIVETAQINLKDENQHAILNQSTHFNPVDVVGSFKKPDGEYYHLKDFDDFSTCFIASKSYEGRSLQAMELPGLWNGSMAKWITIFVEVPLTTFHPVKTVFDLKK